MQLPPYSSYEQHWNHEKNTVFLNHGSFGGCPVPILEFQHALHRKMEKDLIRFMNEDFISGYAENKQALADFVHADTNDLVFVRNATMGVNTILHSLRFEEGDEIITHSHAYGACNNAIEYYAQKSGARIVVAKVPFPVESDEQIIQAFTDAVTPRTRLAMVDHITSGTGIIFPVERIVQELESRGVEVLVDGAHAPGMLNLNIDKIGASYYTGNCHKWICSPKGSALLHVRKDKQEKIVPLQISHKNDLYAGTPAHWSAQFIWPGTEDYTAYLCVKPAIAYMGSIMGNWETLRDHNRKLCLAARKMLAEKLELELPAPASMISHLSTMLVDENPELPARFFGMNPPLKQRLQREFHIQVPVFLFGGDKMKAWLRIAVQAYNSIEQYEYLADCLVKIRRKG
ncbi:MAG: aminotransferase class V-fold PLP-dependent enzyme [Bacteroidia bacterium]